MSSRHTLVLRVAPVLLIGMGFVLGLAVSSGRAPSAHAGGNDRWDQSILTAGPTFVRYNEATKVQVTQDAIYYLDYRAGKLMGMVPSYRQTARTLKLIDSFAERDLVADFKINLDNGPNPHFLMTTGGMSATISGSSLEGWAPLFVVETTTRQLALYRIEQKQIGSTTQTQLVLLEIKPFGKTDVELP